TSSSHGTLQTPDGKRSRNRLSARLLPPHSCSHQSRNSLESAIFRNRETALHFRRCDGACRYTGQGIAIFRDLAPSSTLHPADVTPFVQLTTRSAISDPGSSSDAGPIVSVPVSETRSGTSDADPIPGISSRPRLTPPLRLDTRGTH